MSLEIKPTSKWWYARIMTGGKRPLINLGIPIKGKRPNTLRERGDATFERSRGQAEQEYRRLQDEAKRKRSSEEMVQKIHEIRTGDRVESLSIGQMFATWKAMPRKRPPSDRYVIQAESVFRRFTAFLKEKCPSAKELHDVQSRMASAFLAREEARGIAPKTYNNALILLRSTFNQLRKQAGLVENPFEGIPTKEEGTIFRKPFTAQELADIHTASLDDNFIRPVIVTAMCTALRRGDCCLLRKADVDLQHRFVTVKTSKTGETVEIPMFPLLYDELHSLSDSESDYVFPKQAEMYRKNPDGITWRVKQALKKAGFYDAESNDDTSHRGNIHGPRKNGLRDASIRDFHSFRVTWVTLALTSGVPMELVRKVTGHRTIEIVLKHYFQPGREDFRNALENKMPKLLSSVTSKTRKAKDLISLITECRTQLESMSAETWKTKKNHILQIMNQLPLQESSYRNHAR